MGYYGNIMKQDIITGITLIALVILAVITATDWYTTRNVAARVDEIETACVGECHPRISKVIDDECYCAVEKGWERYGENK